MLQSCLPFDFLFNLFISLTDLQLQEIENSNSNFILQFTFFLTLQLAP